MEWKWNGKGTENGWKKKQKSSGNKLIGMGMELEWKWNGKLSTEKDNVQWNGNRMEMEWNKIEDIKWKQNLMEWNGNGMEKEWK